MTGLGHGRHDERLHARARVVRVLLAEAGVDDVDDAVDRERGLGDVGGEHHLARAGLDVSRQLSAALEHVNRPYLKLEVWAEHENIRVKSSLMEEV